MIAEDQWTSKRGTQFRIWATQRLREYLVKGFVMEDERLKEGRNIGADYFDVLLEFIRDIRANENPFLFLPLATQQSRIIARDRL
jgi:hypothetical protein